MWATPFATEPNGKPGLRAARRELGPGGERFGQAMIVDPNIDEATGTSPDLAVSSTGQADVVYRVVEHSSSTVSAAAPRRRRREVRVAHFDGERWSTLGADQPRPRRLDAPADAKPTRRRSRSARPATASSSGRSPKSNGVARIWARRIFGTSLDYVLPVTATSFNGAPIADDADAPSVAFSRLGQAEVAYRQPAGPGSPLPGPRIFLNTLPDGESESGAEFLGASVADPDVARRQRPRSVGPPSIDIDEQRETAPALRQQRRRRAWSKATTRACPGALSLGLAVRRRANSPAASVMNPEGGGVSAWPSADAQGAPGGGVREDFPGGAVQTGARERRRRRRRSANSPSGARASATGSSPSARARSATPRSSPRRSPRRPAPFVVTRAERLGQAGRRRGRPGQPAASANGPLRYQRRARRARAARPAGRLRGCACDPRGLGSRPPPRAGARDRHRRPVDAVRAGRALQSRRRAADASAIAPRGAVGVSVRVSDRYSGVAAPRRSASASATALRRAGARAVATATRAPASIGSSCARATSSATRASCASWVSVR